MEDRTEINQHRMNHHHINHHLLEDMLVLLVHLLVVLRILWILLCLELFLHPTVVVTGGPLAVFYPIRRVHPLKRFCQLKKQGLNVTRYPMKRQQKVMLLAVSLRREAKVHPLWKNKRQKTWNQRLTKQQDLQRI
ncbi:hypothetical protein TcCL_Unassigned04164 [Trypanosoma cruzi]|nr:hypothetical protein TcCL_Unassigned04164 [Trypanosoma cruzi]